MVGVSFNLNRAVSTEVGQAKQSEKIELESITPLERLTRLYSTGLNSKELEISIANGKYFICKITQEKSGPKLEAYFLQQFQSRPAGMINFQKIGLYKDNKGPAEETLKKIVDDNMSKYPEIMKPVYDHVKSI